MRIWMWYFEEDSMTEAPSWARSSAGRGCAWQALHRVMERMSCLQALDPAPSPPQDFSFSRVDQGSRGEVAGPEHQQEKAEPSTAHLPAQLPSCLRSTLDLTCGYAGLQPFNTIFLTLGLQIWRRPSGVCIWENDRSLALEAPPKVGSPESGFWASGQGGPGILTSGCGAVPTVSAGLGIRQAGAPSS